VGRREHAHHQPGRSQPVCATHLPERVGGVAETPGVV
jgi:hypothetical protein